jgi:hypothetical protein
MTVFEILNQYGFATLAAVAMGYLYLLHIYFYYTRSHSKLGEAMSTA